MYFHSFLIVLTYIYSKKKENILLTALLTAEGENLTN